MRTNLDCDWSTHSCTGSYWEAPQCALLSSAFWYPDGPWVTVLQWRTTHTGCSMLKEPGATAVFLISSRSSNRSAKLWVFAFRNVKHWACCARKSFQWCTKKHCTHAIYVFHLANQVLELKPLRAITFVPLKKNHSIQGQFQHFIFELELICRKIL